MTKAEALSREIDEIIEALRVTLATNLEAITKRADALADLSLNDAAALASAMRATAICHVYATMQSKAEAVGNNPEQAEAIVSSLSEGP